MHSFNTILSGQKLPDYSVEKSSLGIVTLKKEIFSTLYYRFLFCLVYKKKRKCHNFYYIWVGLNTLSFTLLSINTRKCKYFKYIDRFAAMHDQLASSLLQLIYLTANLLFPYQNRSRLITLGAEKRKIAPSLHLVIIQNKSLPTSEFLK